MRIVVLSVFVLSTLTSFFDAQDPPELFAPANESEVTALRPELSVRNRVYQRCDSLPPPIQTNYWTDFGGTSCTLDGQPLPVGSLVQAWDPQGVLCGERITDTPGMYKVTSVFGDDPATLRDEGCVLGDTIRFSIDCFPAVTLGPSYSVWSGNGPIRIMNLSAVSNIDSIVYHFELSDDSLFTASTSLDKSLEAGPNTSIVVPFDLSENHQYWWRVKYTNIYGESEYSSTWSFFVNTHNSAPTSFGLIAPPNSLSLPISTTIPTFEWQGSFDPDPVDTIRYTFFLATDSLISFIQIVPGLLTTAYTSSDQLEWGRQYWWRVQANDYKGGFVWSNSVFGFRVMKPGDADSNGRVDITDIVFIINYIFANGIQPYPWSAGDPNCSARIDISDAVYLINYLFASGLAPCGS